jgi:hypothetical protein
MTYRGAVQAGVEVGRVAEKPRHHFAIVNSRFKSEAVSVTAHCHAATALLTREYQGDHRRQSLLSTSTCAVYPLDKFFHISGVRTATGIRGRS